MSQKEMEKAGEVGNQLHTAMRKLMDSRPSSYAWNVVHLLDESWTAFCRAVAEVDADTGPELREVFESLVWWPDPNARTRESFYARQIFRLALEDFDEDDWAGFAGYLGDDDE